MTLLANRRKFGRYVFAIGGNPEAAELGGINVRRTLMLTFTLMGILTAVSAAIQTARLNGATTNLGIQAELDVIAAAVIGGTSFAGGIGTIPGAILGAVVMQSLRSGMLLLERRFAYAGRRRRHRARRRRRASTPGSDGGTRDDQRTGDRGAVRRSGTCRSGAVPTGVPLVDLRSIRVTFGGVHAVENVSVDLHAGEVVGLVGGNGAGKSTLMKVLSGAQRADAGEIWMDGKPVTIANPRDAKALGIETIYQTLALADNIDASGNLFLGRELTTRSGALDDSAMESATRKVMARLNPRFKNFKVAGQVAVRRPAPIGGHRPRRPFQRPLPDHGRAHRGARPHGDGPGARPGGAAEDGRHRHLPHQPRHP